MERNEEVLKKILENYKSIQEFYHYPTAGSGEVIAETYNYNGHAYNENLKNIINLMVQLGAAAAGARNDNKIAVKVSVDGLDFPVYFCKKDGRYCITKDIYPIDKQEPIKVYWNLEH